NPAIAAPNAFTPNADGLNDVFMIKAENISNFKMYIYDRWGTQIYESSVLEEGWNGDFKGSQAPTGAYVWLVIYDIGMGDVERETKRISGTLVLLR
ncbi:MAG: gliding motility-associated C-terminal domain-containing protein, partial [Bacteroidales bacterium]|nr:gliding motility-associated C-terminal domain-containing protein [Bacteroidales bacterium]